MCWCSTRAINSIIIYNSTANRGGHFCEFRITAISDKRPWIWHPTDIGCACAIPRVRVAIIFYGRIPQKCCIRIPAFGYYLLYAKYSVRQCEQKSTKNISFWGNFKFSYYFMGVAYKQNPRSLAVTLLHKIGCSLVP